MSRSRGTGAIVTTALFAATRKHERLTRFLEQGQARANLRAAKHARDQKAREIQSIFNLPKEISGINKLKKRFRLGRKRQTVIEQIVSVRGIPLKDFPRTVQKPKGVAFQIRKGQTRILQSAFRVGSYQDNIFTRRSAARGPLKQRYGPSLGQMSLNPRVTERGANAYHKRAEEELRKEEQRAFNRAGFKS
jgi:hypothetical protein